MRNFAESQRLVTSYFRRMTNNDFFLVYQKMIQKVLKLVNSIMANNHNLRGGELSNNDKLTSLYRFWKDTAGFVLFSAQRIEETVEALHVLNTRQQMSSAAVSFNEANDGLDLVARDMVPVLEAFLFLMNKNLVQIHSCVFQLFADNTAEAILSSVINLINILPARCLDVFPKLEQKIYVCLEVICTQYPNSAVQFISHQSLKILIRGLSSNTLDLVKASTSALDSLLTLCYNELNAARQAQSEAQNNPNFPIAPGGPYLSNRERRQQNIAEKTAQQYQAINFIQKVRQDFHVNVLN